MQRLPARPEPGYPASRTPPEVHAVEVLFDVVHAVERPLYPGALDIAVA